MDSFLTRVKILKTFVNRDKEKMNKNQVLRHCIIQNLIHEFYILLVTIKSSAAE